MEFKIASCVSEREAAFRLVHRRYVESNLDTDNPYAMRVTPHHLLDTTTVFIGKHNGEVVSTLTLVEDGELGLPMEAMYAAEIERRRRADKRVAEVTCLADRRKDMRRFVKMFLSLSRLVAQFAYRQGVDELLATVHPRHAPFYRKYCGFEEFAGLSRCPYVGHNPAVGLILSFENCERHKPRCYEEVLGARLPDSHFRREHVKDCERQRMTRICSDTNSSAASSA